MRDPELFLDLTLHVTDPDLREELASHPEGRARHDYAVGALKIGALALRHAQGRIDTDRIRNEGDRLIGDLTARLAEHERTVNEKVTARLKEYFDPESGRFSERVERLVRKDGELESVLRSQLEGESSELARTLAAHVGKHSPLMRLLDPSAAEGVVSGLARSVEETLDKQREHILAEFSLDNSDGALARLVKELGERHGEVGTALEKRIAEVVSEFSLDRDDSALSRLVRRVETAQHQISREFSLDEETSALARMKRELLGVIEAHRQVNDQFQQQVLAQLAGMASRKLEADRSTRHGDDFEAKVFARIQQAAQQMGDIAERVGNTVGLIRNCKKGDILVELGPEHAAAGAKIVVEAKENASFGLAQARAEADQARANRGAPVSVFVFSSRLAPDGLSGLERYGSDIMVVWDADDPRTDIVLEAGLSVARALSVRLHVSSAAESADFEAIDRIILDIERQAAGLDEITRWTETIQSNGSKIVNRARLMRERLSKETAELGEKVADLKRVIDDRGGE